MGPRKPAFAVINDPPSRMAGGALLHCELCSLIRAEQGETGPRIARETVGSWWEAARGFSPDRRAYLPDAETMLTCPWCGHQFRPREEAKRVARELLRLRWRSREIKRKTDRKRAAAASRQGVSSPTPLEQAPSLPTMRPGPEVQASTAPSGPAAPIKPEGMANHVSTVDFHANVIRGGASPGDRLG
jgi:uncharacterized C2H2 Zn-finger protein